MSSRRPITIDDFEHFEVDERENFLYWKGRPLKTVSKVSFGWLGKVVGAVIAFAGLSGPVITFLAFYDKIKANVCGNVEIEFVQIILRICN